MNIDLLFLLVVLALIIPAVEFLYFMIRKIVKGDSFPWKQWIIETISLVILGIILFLMYEADFF